jgi:ABC-type dipeptide/oligopeptide/nickel transport system ATPase component
MADRVAVMYAGYVVETGEADDLFYDARHPYTHMLLESIPASTRTATSPCTPSPASRRIF